MENGPASRQRPVKESVSINGDESKSLTRSRRIGHEYSSPSDNLIADRFCRGPVDGRGCRRKETTEKTGNLIRCHQETGVVSHPRRSIFPFAVAWNITSGHPGRRIAIEATCACLYMIAHRRKGTCACLCAPCGSV